MYQFHPQHERARALVRTGEIGAIRGVNVSLTFNLVKLENNFRLGTIETGGGSLYDLACYCIHAIRKLLGEPAHAAAFGRYDDTGMVDWSTVAVLGYADGLKAGFDCGMDATGRHRYEIIGTQGTLRVLKAFVPQADGEGLIEITDNEGQVRHERVVADFYREGVAHFADCILSGRCPAHSPADTLANMRVLDACIAALQNKAVTPVSGPEPSP
jgi:predicted dehydrogenase